MTAHKRNSINHVSEDSDYTIKDRYPFKYPLDVGNHGIQVLIVQSALARLGFYGGNLTGRYDRTLTKSVRAFQSDYGLHISGIVDRTTWSLL
jgi:peptidoglycan hydrolase-like protein with peptidoglycan-binding domain